MDLNGSVAVITGGSSGLGRATVQRFAAHGAKVAILDLNEKDGQGLAGALGKQVMYCHVDVTQEDLVGAAINQAHERFGAIHICCNYAGVGGPRRVLSKSGPYPLEEFRRRVDINLIGTFNVLRLAAAKMAENEPLTADGERGVIINTASIAAYEGQIGQSAYSAAKGGIVAMTLPLARDLAPLGIRVNTIVPGIISTPMMRGAPDDIKASVLAQIQFPKRFGEADEIAHLAQFLVENRYMNGESIRIDGGIRMSPS